MPPATSNPLALRLRHDTAEQHRQLETALDLLRPDMPRENHVATLLAFHGFLLPWEALVARRLSGPLAERLRPRRHAWRLVQDITALTGHAPASLGSEICSALPELGSDAAVLGSMYVIEGSTLGGQIIGAHMHEKFGLTPENGCAYFSGYGEQNGRMWSAFRNLLDECVPTSAHDEAVRAAIDTFDCMCRWFIQQGVASAGE